MRTVPSALGVLLGLALAVYGLASLTGAWLGAPPWWEEVEVERARPTGQHHEFFDWSENVPAPARPEVGVGLIAGGILVAGVAAWPRPR